MTKISITFICGFPKDGGKVKKKPKQSKKAKKSDSSNLAEKEASKIDLNCITVTSIDNFVHIEYNLVPRLPPCVVDVVSWGKITKVCTKQEATTMKSIESKENFWSVFTVENRLILSEEEVIALKSHTITINMRLSKAKIPERLKGDKTKIFYLKETDMDPEIKFAEAFQNENIDESKPTNREIVSNFIDEILNFPTPFEIIQKLPKLPVEMHRSTILKKINKTVGLNAAECHNNNINEFIPVVEKTKGKRGKRGKSPKPKKDLVSIHFSGELFFTDPTMFSLQVKEKHPKLPWVYLLITVKDLMSPEQRQELNPFIVKIHKLSNLPTDILLSNSFISVNAVCNVGNLFEYTTSERYISEEVNFKVNFAKFTNKILPLQYTEAIQSGFVHIKIFGRILKTRTRSTQLFGKNKSDKNVSKPLLKQDLDNFLQKQTDVTTVLLFVAFLKLDTLRMYSPCTTFTKIQNCLHPNNINVKGDSQQGIQDMLNPLNDEILLRYGTSLEVEISLTRPFKLPRTIPEPQAYRRIIFVVYNKLVAKSILAQVLINNQCHLGPNILVPNFSAVKDFDAKELNLVNVVTGFVVDFDNCFIMFFEGITNGIIRKIWVQIKTVFKVAAKIFYNSELIFENRLYGQLIPYGAVYVVTLQMGLKLILTNKDIFLHGVHSDDCRRAMQKIILMQRSTTINELNYEMLPTISELLSLDIECGVPLYKKLFKLDKNTQGNKEI